MPGVDRARGPHHRPAPPPGDDGLPLSHRGRADAARRRARLQPVGQGAVGAGRLGRGAGRARAGARGPRARGPLLGGLRCVRRRARPRLRTVDGQAAAGRRRGLRDPGPARVVHGRPGAAHGQRVPLPGPRRAEREHAQRCGRDQDRGQLPALLQHARQRVRRLRWRLRGDAPLRAAGRAGARRAAPAGQERGRHHLPRLLLPGPAQRCPRRPARAGRGGGRADRDEAQRQAHVLLRGGRRAHVDGGARREDQRGARARGDRNRRLDPRCRLPVLHADARRRRQGPRHRHARWRQRCPDPAGAAAQLGLQRVTR